MTVVDERTVTLEECVDRLEARGFDPADEDSLHAAARDLRQLGNDRRFLGDIMIGQLERRCRVDPQDNAYGPQTVMLSRPNGRFFLRANIWPSPADHMFRASGADAFFFGLPHDHNFSFLTLGYFGPGYWSDYYEYDYEGVAGYRGEPVDLRFVETSRLEEGRILLYRAHRDIHVQKPADALSVSLNIMHMAPGQSWFDQYQFDLENGCIAGILSHGPSEVMLRLAVALGDGEGERIARDFGTSHPSDRMRLAAWEALAIGAGPGARDAVWRDAERSGSLLVAGEAKRRRSELARQASS